MPDTPETVLKACPFCGENKHVVNATRRVSEKWLGYSDDRDKMLTFHTIRCLTCGTEPGRVEDYATPQAAIAAWNTRAPSSAPEVSELVEALEACRRYMTAYATTQAGRALHAKVVSALAKVAHDQH